VFLRRAGKETVMSTTATLEQIGRLAERRQALWSKLMLTPEEKAEIGRLTVELEALWERHRMELARPPATARPISRGVTPLRRSSAA
jgi:hypothetical protein